MRGLQEKNWKNCTIMTDSKVLIIGPIPENHGIGGVTIHVRRLLDYLNKVGFGYRFVDYGKVSWGALIKEIRDAKVIHAHVSNPVYQFVVVLISRLLGKKAIVTLHGNYGRFSSFKNFLVRQSLSMAIIPILINEKSYEACRCLNKQAVLIPAFIPPQKEERLQDEVVELLERLHKEGKKIVSTNAYNISYDKEGNDTYGIDFLTEYFKISKEYSLIVSEPSGNYAKMYGGLYNKKEVEKSVFFINFPHPYYELLKHVDYFVRNTSTDGDALSVKEALYLGVPALCSDVVDRPDGVRLFKYSDAESFEKALKTGISAKPKVENGAEKIMEVYKALL